MAALKNIHPTTRGLNWVWSVGLLDWTMETQPAGGGGGAVTIADGADATQGSAADSVWTSGSGTVISVLKAIAARISSLTLTPTNATGVSSSIVSANASRVYLLIANNSAVPAFLAFTGAATTSGLLLGAGGSWSTGDGKAVYTGSVQAITAGGTAALTVVEG